MSLLPVLHGVNRVRNKAFALAVRSSFAAWGEGTSVRTPFRIGGASGISLGANVNIGEGCWFQTIDGGVIEIGDRCHFAGNVVISAAGSIVLEPKVIVARNVHILDHQHRYDVPGVPVLEQGQTAARPVRLGEGSWIGANVVILPGVTVGRQAVVGANSVVRADVPPATVVGGTPARVLAEIS
jgi:acetyltransferase-like isoleucine patch superfamily enzyme